MAWVEVRIELDAGQAEVLAERLPEAGALAVSLDAVEDAPIFDQGGDVAELWPRTRVTGLFDADADIPARLAGLWLALGWAPPPYRIDVLADADWVAGMRAQFEPRAYGDGRLWVRPSWCEPQGPPDREIVLDPGLAFGTGEHPTTALCLDWLAGEAPLEGRRVIDYGCGSGILAIAAVRGGATDVRAVDIDPRAVSVTRDNAAANGVAERVQALLPEALGSSRADIVVANILLNPLVALAPRLTALTLPGGWIALTGLLESQARECAAAYERDFEFEPPRCRAGWALLLGRRRPC